MKLNNQGLENLEKVLPKTSVLSRQGLTHAPAAKSSTPGSCSGMIASSERGRWSARGRRSSTPGRVGVGAALTEGSMQCKEVRIL
jgi:hypothetical protein